MLRRAPGACVVLALILVGCDRPNPEICIPPKPITLGGDLMPVPASPRTDWGYQRENSLNCVHRWAYRLAKAPGSNEQAARAVIGGCGETIDRMAVAWREGVEDGRNLPMRNPATGAFVEPEEASTAEMYGYALFYVAGGRAGNCRAP